LTPPGDTWDLLGDGNHLVPTKEFIESVVNLCPDAILAVNREGIIVLMNPAAERLTGFTKAEAVGKLAISQVYNPPELARQIKKKIYSEAYGGIGIVDGLEVETITRQGKTVPIRLSAALLRENGEETGSVGIFHDMTVRKRLEERLRELSITDSLTGLHNRRQFFVILNQEVERCRRYKRPLSLVCFDLDNFKPFNDNFGHQEGDNILRMVASTARATLRSQDHAFRYGGDEFCLLMVETSLEAASLAADRFRRDFNERWPLTISLPDNHLGPVYLSLGVAELQAGEAPENLLKRADLAMYEAKNNGGNRVLKAASQIGSSLESGD
jgi:diguanylate cyclase (GGDEF)-like protein/PAS domain S-box-containing protein